MRGRFTRLFSTLVLLGASLLLCAAADAQIRYVASTGSNASPCTHPTAPCRTLQRAIDTAPAGGEVRVLDSGSFGPATINKSLAVSSNGETIFGQIKVDAPGANVVLRGFTLNGNGNPDNGIDVRTASAVHIEDCVVERFGGHGIAWTAKNAELFVVDTTSRDNGTAGLEIFDNTAGPGDLGSIKATIDNSRFENNATDGMLLFGGKITITRTILAGQESAHGIASSFANVSVTDTVMAHNWAGMALQAAKGAIESSVYEDNNIGMYINGAEPDAIGVGTLSNSVFAHNRTVGVRLVDGTGLTRGDNTFVENGADVSEPLTPLPGR